MLRLLLAALCLLTAPAFGQSPDKLTLTLLHTNDLHGHIFPFAYTETGRSKDEKPSVGGAARRATLVRELRAKIRNPVMLVDSGDTFTRGPLTNAYEGVADIEAMNAVGYELAAIGNNEFKAKDGADVNDAPGAQAALLRVVKRSKFPWLCANATDEKGAFLQGVQPYVVRLISGVRVGFLGLTAPRSATYPQTKGWTISDPIAAAKLWILKARAECDILIAVTHIGVDLDKELAAQTSGLDAIVGGDSHTFLYQPLEVKNTEGVGVPIVQDGEFGVNLGRFDLQFARAGNKWRLTGYRDELLPVGSKIREARDVAETMEPFRRPFEKVVGKVKVGATPDERTRLTTQTLADALKSATGADLALNPSGAGLFNAFHSQNVTRFDVYAALPFHNNTVTAQMTGAEVKALLAASPTTMAAGDMNALDAAKTYKVAFVDFIAGDAYKLPAERLTATGLDIREAVISYLSGSPAPRPAAVATPSSSLSTALGTTASLPAPAASPFTFVVFGDNRPPDEKSPLPAVFPQMLAEIKRLHPAFVVTTGDLIFGSKTDLALVNKEYDEALPLVKALGVPVYFAAGNHEIRGVPANEALYRKRVSDRLYYSFDYGGSHFVVLDSDVVGEEHKITGAQRAWLENDLKMAQGRARHTFVFQHQQPYPVSWHIGSSLDAFPADRDAFQSLLERYKVEALITGHEHLYDDSVHGGVREIIAGGAGAPLYPSARGGSFYHYLVVTVDGDKTSISVVKPGSIFGADDVLTLAPSEKKDPGKPPFGH